MLPLANKQIKTETTIGLEETEHYDWVSERDFNNMPSNVKNEVALVFGIKEMKSMLQFSTQGGDETSLVTLSFHWGGRPLIVETKGKGFIAQLVLATLDHSLLGRLTKVSSTHTEQ